MKCTGLLFFLLVFFSAMARTAEPVYVNSSRIRIDYSVKEKGGAGLQKVELWYTEDNGKTWMKYGEDADRVSTAVFDAKTDGTYGFRTLTVDKAGNREATPKTGDKPDTVVVVDRKKPGLVLFRPVKDKVYMGGDTLAVGWKVQDENPAKSGFVLEFSAGKDRAWKTITDKLEPASPYSWTIPKVTVSGARLRLTAVDRAGNTAQAVSDAFHVDSSAPVAVITGPRRTRLFRYDVTFKAVDRGDAGIASVALWVTRNNGKKWFKYATVKGSDNSFRFEAKESGRYGFAAVAADHAGNAEPDPESGTRPEFVTLMDAEKPVVKLLSFDKGGAFAGRKTYSITWKAEDDNMKEKPIRLEYSSDNGKIWNIIDDRIPNNGTYKWSIPPVNSTRCRIRLSAFDKADNKAMVVSTAPFSVDSSPPRSRVRAIVPKALDGSDKSVTDKDDKKKTRDELLLSSKRPTLENLFAQADQLIEKQKFKQAMDVYRKAQVLKPREACVYYRIGLLESKYLNVHDRAVDSMLKAVALDPDYEPARIGIARLYYKESEFYEKEGDGPMARKYKLLAADHYRAAIRIMPDSFEEYCEYGVTLFQLKKTDMAEEYLLKSLTLSECPDMAYWYLARCYEKRDPQKAVTYWRKAEKAYGVESSFGQLARENAKALELKISTGVKLDAGRGRRRQ